jgi:hypothetical protein
MLGALAHRRARQSALDALCRRAGAELSYPDLQRDVSGGGFELTYNSRNATDTRSELGARFDRQMLLNRNAVLALRGRVAWAHDWISDPSLVPVFEALPGASFIVNGATPAKNSALTSAGCGTAADQRRLSARQVRWRVCHTLADIRGHRHRALHVVKRA